MKSALLQIAIIGMAVACHSAYGGPASVPSLDERIDAVLKGEASGEKTQGDDRTLQQQFDDAYQVGKDVVVPLPAETPYDADPSPANYSSAPTSMATRWHGAA